LLAGLGLAGVVAYDVTRRRSEIGVRMALGASSAGVVRLVLAGTLRLVLAGIAAGLPGAWAARRVLARWLYEVGPWDPLAPLVAIGLVVVVAAAAAVSPAWRAARIEPTAALRCE
jgi:ABC-type antimicrobial peptide transport system permease subunit